MQRNDKVDVKDRDLYMINKNIRISQYNYTYQFKYIDGYTKTLM